MFIYHCPSCPIEFAIVHIAFAIEEILEQSSQVVVVGRFKEVQPSHVPQVGGKLFWVIFAENLHKSIEI